MTANTRANVTLTSRGSVFVNSLSVSISTDKHFIYNLC